MDINKLLNNKYQQKVLNMNLNKFIKRQQLSAKSFFKDILATFTTSCKSDSVLTGTVTVELPIPGADTSTIIASAKLVDSTLGS